MASRPARFEPDAADCADARLRFLTESDPAGRVRPKIAASWQRSRELGVAADRVQVPYVRDPDVDTPLTRSAEPVLARLFEKLHDKAVSIILTDAAGLVLSRRTHDTAFETRLDHVLLAPGFSFAERFVGTNGIGTALESGSATQVLGHEHYAENLEMFACAAVPIHDRSSGRMAGVMNLTCRRHDADPLLLTLAETTAEQIEYALQADAGLRELGVLQAYRRTCRRTSGLVLAVTADAVTLNDRARTELAPGDQNAVLAHAHEVGARLSAGRRRCVDVTLPSGGSARLYLHQVEADSARAGLVVQVKPMDDAAAAQVVDAPPGLAGTSPLWRRAYRDAAAAHRTGRRLAVVGEPGVGKLALIRSVLQGQRHVVIDPVSDPNWRAALRDALNGADAVVVRHADRAGLGDLLDVPTRAWVAATMSEAADVPVSFSDVVEVPPLRLRLEDVTALVPALVGGDVTCSPEAMRLLTRASWPGNVEQLRLVLRGIVQHRRSGRIEAADLPPELHAASRRLLTPLESIERDAIVRSLADTNGNKGDAARALGISRATIYRRIHEYGIFSAG